MDYNEVTSALLIFGGNQGINTVYNDIWAYDFTTGLYSNLVPTNDQVPGTFYLDSRITSGGFVDSSQNKFFVFGGMTTNGPQNDLWSFELSGLKWNRESPIGPSPTSRYRYGYTKYYDGIFLKFIIFGGSLIDGESNETLV